MVLIVLLSCFSVAMAFVNTDCQLHIRDGRTARQIEELRMVEFLTPEAWFQGFRGKWSETRRKFVPMRKTPP